MPKQSPLQDPLELLREMWSSMGFSIPGMVTPTLDADEIERRISDLKAVEAWLKMNLNTLQMSIQGLEMQRTTLAAVRVMTSPASADPPPANNAFSTAALWPWSLFDRNEADAATPPETDSKARRRAPRAK